MSDVHMRRIEPKATNSKLIANTHKLILSNYKMNLAAK